MGDRKCIWCGSHHNQYKSCDRVDMQDLISDLRNDNKALKRKHELAIEASKLAVVTFTEQHNENEALKAENSNLTDIILGEYGDEVNLVAEVKRLRGVMTASIEALDSVPPDRIEATANRHTSLMQKALNKEG